MEKVTKKIVFEKLVEFVSKSNFELKTEAINYLNTDLKAIERKANATSIAKKQKEVENNELRNEIINTFKNLGKGFYNTEELKDSNEVLKGLSTSKISYLMKELLENQVVERKEEKRKVYYKLVKVD